MHLDCERLTTAVFDRYRTFVHQGRIGSGKNVYRYKTVDEGFSTDFGYFQDFPRNRSLALEQLQLLRRDGWCPDANVYSSSPRYKCLRPMHPRARKLVHRRSQTRTHTNTQTLSTRAHKRTQTRAHAHTNTRIHTHRLNADTQFVRVAFNTFNSNTGTLVAVELKFWFMTTGHLIVDYQSAAVAATL